VIDQIDFRRVEPDDPEAVALAAAHVSAVDSLYADRPLPGAPALADLLGPGDRLLVAYLRGEAIALETEAVELGCERVRLDTGSRQLEALSLYRSTGYQEIDDYNGQPGVEHWFEKRLRRA
jgi:hypothetical protein